MYVSKSLADPVIKPRKLKSRSPKKDVHRLVKNGRADLSKSSNITAPALIRSQVAAAKSPRVTTLSDVLTDFDYSSVVFFGEK